MLLSPKNQCVSCLFELRHLDVPNIIECRAIGLRVFLGSFSTLLMSSLGFIDIFKLRNFMRAACLLLSFFKLGGAKMMSLSKKAGPEIP